MLLGLYFIIYSFKITIVQPNQIPFVPQPLPEPAQMFVENL